MTKYDPRNTKNGSMRSIWISVNVVIWLTNSCCTAEEMSERQLGYFYSTFCSSAAVGTKWVGGL